MGGTDRVNGVTKRLLAKSSEDSLGGSTTTEVSYPGTAIGRGVSPSWTSSFGGYGYEDQELHMTELLKVKAYSSPGDDAGLKSGSGMNLFSSNLEAKAAEVRRADGADSLKLAAAVIAVRSHTVRAQEQEARAKKECKALEDELEGLAAAKAERETQVAKAIEEMTRLSSEAVDNLRARVDAAARRAEGQAGVATLRSLRKQVELKDRSIRRLRAQCEALQAELAEAFCDQRTSASGSSGSRASTRPPDSPSKENMSKPAVSTAAAAGSLSHPARTAPDSDAIVAELRRQLAAARDKRRREVAFLEEELRRRRRLRQEEAERSKAETAGQTQRQALQR
mmetsp:Transcript_51504/g.122479  ORF Transcript_51504/g.122479 Transcript_51504/m.122479 type:complete len:338 (+) Transcript_51504:104-1117(+)